QCFGDLATLTAVVSNGAAPFQYNWSNGSQGTSITESVNSSVEDYIVSVTDGCGAVVSDTGTVACSYDTEWFVSVSNADLLEGDTVTICELWADTMVASVTGGGLPPFAYTWSGTLIDGMYVNNDTAVIRVNYELPPDSSVVETYTLSVIDQCNVETIVNIPVAVISCDVVQPNVFNPESNYQGGNDFCGSVPQNNVFNLPCLELYPGNKMTIWDRWGRKCYQTENYHLNPWDGGNQSSGTYYYVCELPGDKEPVKGYFQLLR
ncbi:MAG: gliding motility-associated C-terminal domain-containing protein, partial [Bacteroidetes bacterium]